MFSVATHSVSSLNQEKSTILLIHLPLISSKQQKESANYSVV